jgi:hypothetical protein
MKFNNLPNKARNCHNVIKGKGGNDDRTLLYLIIDRKSYDAKEKNAFG